MTNRAIRVLLAVSMFAPAAVMAGPSYNYIEAGYQSVDLDDGPTLDGYGLAGSFAVAENFHVFGGLGEVKKSPVTLTSSELGVGYNTPLTGTTDLVLRAAWVHGEVKASGFGSSSDNGWGAQAGVRSMLTEQFELNGFVTHVDLFDDSETGFSIGAVYHFTHNFGLSGGVDASSDATGWNLGVRFSF